MGRRHADLEQRGSARQILPVLCRYRATAEAGPGGSWPAYRAGRVIRGQFVS